MLISSKILREKLKEFSNKNTKISRLVKDKEIFRLKNGLYETDRSTKGYLLAGVIYGPSYLSFEFALSYYGLIPERVVIYTSATLNKRRSKIYNNYFGNYYYTDIPERVYSIGVKHITNEKYPYFIATAEKALSDKLYKLPIIKNLKHMEHMLFFDLRIDEEELLKFDLFLLKEIANKYNSNNVTMLYKYLKKIKEKEVNE